MRHAPAGIPYATPDGVADFPINRVLFITSLCRSNVNLILVLTEPLPQKLARHSDPKLTSNIYSCSKISTTERAAAINGISLEG